jgi:hypothetical protein
MDKTIREKIIYEITALFEGYTFVSITNPAVYRGWQVFDPDVKPPPLVALQPRVEECNRTDYGADERTMPVDIICLERIVDQNPSELGEAILGELIACVFGKAVEEDGAIIKLGGMSTDLADDVVYRTGGIDQYPDQLGEAILHVGITVSVRYTTLAGDPYNQ